MFFFGHTLKGRRIQRGCFSGGKRFFLSAGCVRCLVCRPRFGWWFVSFLEGFSWLLLLLGFVVLRFLGCVPRRLRCGLVFVAVLVGGLGGGRLPLVDLPLVHRVGSFASVPPPLRVVRLGCSRLGVAVRLCRLGSCCLVGVSVRRRPLGGRRRRSVLLARLFLIGIERCWWVGFGSPALFFGGGLVGRCACDRSRCRVCFPLVPVSPALASLLRSVARSVGLRSVPSSLRRVSPGRPVSAAQVARVRRLLGL